MGTININFNARKPGDRTYGVSIVAYPYGVAYGYWNKSNVLIEAGYKETTDYKSCIKELLGDKSSDLKIELSSALLPFVHVPFEHFDPLEADEIFNGIYSKEKIDARSAIFEKLKSRKVFTTHCAIPKLANKLTNQTRHFSSNMVDYLEKADNQILIYFSEHCMHLCYIKDAKFQFYNQFDCYYPEDYLYFLLLSLQEFGITTTEVPIVVSGQITESSEVISLIKQYVDVGFLEIDTQWHREIEYPAHFYHDLYFTWLCG